MFIDYNNNPSKTVVLAGRGRSGTTWIADIINYKNDYRVIFEPFNPDKVDMCKHFGPRRYIRPESRDPLFTQPIDAILRGKIRCKWTDSQNKRFICNKRLIKEVRANLFLKFIKVNYPAIPVILAMRHPCAVIASALRQGWFPALPMMLQQKELVDDYLEPFIDSINSARNDFEQHVFSWCIEHYILFKQFRIGEIHVIFYEELCENSDKEIERLFNFLGNKYDDRVLQEIQKPSFTTIDKESMQAINMRENLIDRWRQHVTKEDIKRAVDILSMFGLDRIYTELSRPNLTGTLEILKDNNQ